MLRMNCELKRPVPTASGSAGTENSFNLRIHHDADLSLVLYPTVSSIYFLTNPVLEFLPDNGPDNVGDVRSRQFEDLFSLTGQSSHGISVWVAFCVLNEVINGQAIEIWHLDHLHLITADASSLVAAQIS